jgi:hypothetical protein
MLVPIVLAAAALAAPAGSLAPAQAPVAGRRRRRLVRAGSPGRGRVG